MKRAPESIGRGGASRFYGYLLVFISLFLASHWSTGIDDRRASANGEEVPPPQELSASVIAPCPEGDACLFVAWDANTEPDLAGYIVHRGRESGKYTESFKVAELPGQWTNPDCKAPYDPFKTQCCEFTIIGHKEPGVYYYAATAYDEDGNESDYSEELEHTFIIHKPSGLLMPEGLIVKPDNDE